MLSVTEKLRLLTEGYSIEEINRDMQKFKDILSESSFFNDELSMFLESVNADLEFIYETHSIYIQESVLDTFAEKIKKIISWIIEKIVNIINWIKSKFSKKTYNVTKIADEVEMKIKSGELSDVIDALKNDDKEGYFNAKSKHRSKLSDGKIHIDINKFKGSVADPGRFDRFVNNNIPKNVIRENLFPGKNILKVNISENIINSNIPDMGSMAENIIYNVNMAIRNVESFRLPLIKGKSNSILNTDESILDFLSRSITSNKVSHFKDMKEYILGQSKEIELSVEIVSKIKEFIQKTEEYGDILFKSYNEMNGLLVKWKEESVNIINKYKDSKEIKPETLTRRIDQVMRLITGSINLLNTLLSINSEAINECETILNRLKNL